MHQSAGMFLAISIAIVLLSTTVGKSLGQEGDQQQQTANKQPQQQQFINIPHNLVERLFNSTSSSSSSTGQQADVWLLVSSEFNLGNLQASSGELNLFKLNNGALATLANNSSSEQVAAESDEFNREPRDGSFVGEQTSAGGRQARKFHFFKNVLNKPRVSPLYLVNGTVCRFVNSQPICTTLSTTGLIRPNQFNQSSGFFNGNQQQNNGFQNNNNNNLQPNQRQVNPQLMNMPGGGQFANNQLQNQNQNQLYNNNNNNQQFRQTAALMDNNANANANNNDSSSDSSDLKVESRNSNQQKANGGNPMASNNNNNQQQQSAARPLLSMTRRPINLMALMRPFRQ